MAIYHLRSASGRRKQQKLGDGTGPGVFVPDDKADYLSSKGRAVSAEAVLDVVPWPVALWTTGDHCSGVFNVLTRKLLGYCEHDFQQTPSLWRERIHPEDRDNFVAAWNKLRRGEKRVSCLYRFFPKNKDQEIRLREISSLYYLRDQEEPAIWSFYLEEPNSDRGGDEGRGMRELVLGLTHEIGNSLQAISGELDLLILSGALPQQSGKAVTQGVQQIRKLAREIDEYFSPPPLELKLRDPAEVLKQVVESSELELRAQGIRIAVVVKESLPKLPLDGQFRSALERVVEFSRVLLPQGGELNIEAGLQRIGDDHYVELNLVTASPTFLSVEEKDVFRPFLKVNDCRVGLSMAMARQILRRHFGKIIFRKERRNRGVFSILIKIPFES
jgi:signal transduction histidine kinase